MDHMKFIFIKADNSKLHFKDGILNNSCSICIPFDQGMRIKLINLIYLLKKSLIIDNQALYISPKSQKKMLAGDECIGHIYDQYKEKNDSICNLEFKEFDSLG